MSEELKKTWQPATVVEAALVGSDLRSLHFTVQNMEQYEPGQYYEIRITLQNGFQPDRPFSVANSYTQNQPIEFGVQLLPEGEVSVPLFSLKKGDTVELRGPFGDSFNWTTEIEGPLYLIGGGSGIVPLMSMLRHHLQNLERDAGREIICLFSAKDESRMYYYAELQHIVQKDPHIKVVWTTTGEAGTSAVTFNRRIDVEMIRSVFGEDLNKNQKIYVCGSTPFVVSTVKNMISVGYNPNEIKTERFGGTN